MYASDIAALYDLVHEGKGKDYQSETESIATLIRSWCPDVDSVLDVACGTGQHLRHLAKIFTHVEGVELSRDMRDIALGRNPGIEVHEGDMRDFALVSRFDAVICMFSSIGHLRDTAELESTLARFAEHVRPGGIVVIEPWWFPDDFTPGYVGSSITETGNNTISRMSHSVLKQATNSEPAATDIEVHYLVAESGSGIQHFEERHTITLFTREAYESAFEHAGFDVRYQEGGPSGRGLFIGIRGS